MFLTVIKNSMRDQDWKIIASLYNTKSISKTANLLFITQPALSKRLQMIEQELNTTLFIRTSKGVIFTPEGEYVAERARSIFEAIEEVQHNLENVSNGQVGTLLIGAPNSYTRFVLPALIQDYSRQYPDVKIMITTALSNQVIHLAEDRSIQIGFARGTVPSALEKVQLSEDQIYLVSHTPSDLEHLPDLPQIDYVKEPSIVQATNTWWYRHYDKKPNIRMKVNRGDTCLAMIRHDLGYGIISDSRFFRNDPELYYVPMINKDGTAFTRKTWMVYHPAELQNHLAANFINYVKGIDFENF